MATALGPAHISPPCPDQPSRPITAATLAFNYALGALKPSGYRVFNIVVHLLCALALYGVLARSITDSTRTLAFSCALLWLVHPLNSQCVNYTYSAVNRSSAFFIC